MSSELAVVQQDERRIAQVPVMDFSSTQVQLLRDTIAQGCDPNEFALFLEIAKLKRLDPFNGQIRPVKRWDSTLGREKMTVQVGIDGYRVIGARTGELAGIDDAVYDCEDGDHPKWARVTVYRWSRGEKIPYTATARWSEYVQKKKDGTPNSMWTKMPFLMLGKVAEALALRKAFPDELSGIYTNEEMAQADNVIEGQPQQEKKPPVTMPQEKKPEGHVLSNGVITARKDGKEGSLWVTIQGRTQNHILAIPSDQAGSHPFNVGDFMEYTATERKGKEREFWVLEVVHDYKPNVDDPLPPMDDTPVQAKPKDEMDKAIDAGILSYDEKESIGTLEETRTGKIGRKREIRLQTLMGKNKDKNNNLKWEDVHKILEGMEPPVEHVRDLSYSEYHSMFEKLVLGEEDWRELV